MGEIASIGQGRTHVRSPSTPSGWHPATDEAGGDDSDPENEAHDDQESI
jgi:hypothetical protein